MSEKIKTKKWNAIYLRCINAISEYHRTGTVYVNLVSTRKDYVFPVPFKESADAYIGYREKIGIVAKSIQVSKLYLSRFFSFLEDGYSEYDARFGAARTAYRFLEDNELFPTIKDQ